MSSATCFILSTVPTEVPPNLQTFIFKSFLVILFLLSDEASVFLFVLEGSFPKWKGEFLFQFSYNASEDTL